MWFSTIVVGLISLLWVSHWVYRWLNPKCTNGKLPPGFMGFPIIGETIQFLTGTSHGFSIPPFIQKRIRKYGPIFKTSLFGEKIVLVTDFEASIAIFRKEEEYLEVAQGESFFPVFEPNSAIISPGAIHKYFKSVNMQLIGLESLQRKIMKDSNASTQKHIHSWANRGVFDFSVAASDMIFEYFANKLMSYNEAKDSKKLKENYNAFVKGLISFPLNIPGTTYRACLKGREKIMGVIQEIIEERKEEQGDFLDYLIAEVKREDTILTKSLARDFCFAFLFATYVNTYATMTIAMNLISQHPPVLAQLKKEHEEIVKKRAREDSEITWEEFKSMHFTLMVINEVLRIGNIAPGLFRKVRKDIEVKGYIIPANWIIMINTAVLHIDPELYEDPLAFNPWRWEGKEMSRGSKSFMAFGLGGRLCSGADLAKLQVAMFLHNFVLNYSWEVIKGGEIIRKPWLHFPNGLHIKMTKLHKNTD